MQVLAQLPDNDVTSAVADAIGQAVGESRVEGGVVLMVVQPGEINAYDQQWLQLAVWERHKVCLGLFLFLSLAFFFGCHRWAVVPRVLLGACLLRWLCSLVRLWQRPAVAPAGGLGASQGEELCVEVSPS